MARRTVIICHCEAVNDRALRAAIAAGATSIDEVTAACAAGGRCGGCHESIERALGTHVETATPVRLAVA